MNNLMIAARSLFRKRRNNLVKIISLGAGLAVGLILITKVLYEQSYDKFYPEAHRLYYAEQNFRRLAESEEPSAYPRTPGAIAGALRTEIPGVEYATLMTELAYDTPVILENKTRRKANLVMADSSFFEVVPMPVISGNAKETLKRPMYILISESLASSMDGDPIGQKLSFENLGGFHATVGGVFEDVPKNSVFSYDIILSFESCTLVWDGWDPRDNWLGNDRYWSIAKLAPGVSVESLEPALRETRKRHVPDEFLEENGISVEIDLKPFSEFYSNSDEVRRTKLMLTIIAFALIIAAVMNYVLIVISTLVSRSREIGVYKCYGARNGDISRLIFTETALHMVMSLILAAALVILFRGTVEQLLAAELSLLFMPKSILALLGICIVILLVAGYLPSRMFAGVPVATVFRGFRGGTKRGWKLLLLFVQFIGASFLLVLVVLIGRQYNAMVNNDPGYKYENVAYYYTGEMDAETRNVALNNLRSLPEVEIAASGSELFFTGLSGNNVYLLEGSELELFNIGDLYFADENYMPLFQVKMVEGEPFSRENVRLKDILVSQEFARRLTAITGWQDGVIGKEIGITEHASPSRICGVYEDVAIGVIGDDDTRPTVLFYDDRPASSLLARLKEITPENVAKVQAAIQEAMPSKEVEVRLYADEMIAQYRPALNFRNSVTVGSIVTLIIVLIGLIGYLRNEIVRRGGEIAVRKVNGATAKDVLKLFIGDISRIALPAIILGGVGAYFVARKWMENMSVQASQPWWLFVLCALAVMIIITAVIVINCIHIANRNPVDTLKSE